MDNSAKQLLAKINILAVASDQALSVKLDKETDTLFRDALKQIDDLIDDLREALKEMM